MAPKFFAKRAETILPHVGLFGQRLRRIAVVDKIDTNTSADFDPVADVVTDVLPIDYDVTLAGANLVLSASTLDDDLHYPVLDMDYGVVAVQSSSPGKHHLYIDKAVSWDKYVAVLYAMADAGLLEQGYVRASIKRGHTAVRLPWVRKGEWAV